MHVNTATRNHEFTGAVGRYFDGKEHVLHQVKFYIKKSCWCYSMSPELETSAQVSKAATQQEWVHGNGRPSLAEIEIEQYTCIKTRNRNNCV
mmetsp:Transcript_35325/g.56397  ORF Transcript_35325/g.56397 Transcript_35325/m.56397 type:complete len:92 (-) Transcript_35325:3286-3561(-)